MFKKRFFKVGMAAALTASMLMSTTALAADFTAKNLKELETIVSEQGVARNGDFTVKFDGTDAEWDVVNSSDCGFYYYNLIKKDDPGTSDDSDYLIGNIDFSQNYFDINEKEELHFTFKYFETKEQTDYVNAETGKILDQLGVASMSNYNKVKTIHDYVCKMITYTGGSDPLVSTVYGAYKNGKGLCNSYALCMYKLLTEAGVPCKWIGGGAGTGRDADGHAWNLVMLGDKWYNLDATWDDGEDGTISYDYFLKGSKDFDEADPGQVHKMDDEYYTTNYLKDYPIAETKFVEGSDDSNTKTPSASEEQKQETDSAYDFDQIVKSTYPDNNKLTIKRKKTDDLQLVLSLDYTDVVQSVDYKVLSGKNKIKVLSCDIYDNDDFFADVEIKGAKKGKAKVAVVLSLTNGESREYVFQIKVK